MWLFAFIPVAVAACGAAWTTFNKPRPAVIGAIQHFAAGVIFYAAAGELLPDAVRQGKVGPIILGGVVGIAAMLVLRSFGKGTAERPTGLLAASGVDAVVDGLVLGLGFSAGQQQGVLLAVAIAIEYLFLGLSMAGAFGKGTARWKVVGGATGVALAVPLGVLISQPIGALSQSWHTAAFSFGLIALLYLVTEELLTEAHAKPETRWGAAMFFTGFLILMVLNQIV